MKRKNAEFPKFEDWMPPYLRENGTSRDMKWYVWNGRVAAKKLLEQGINRAIIPFVEFYQTDEFEPFPIIPIQPHDQINNNWFTILALCNWLISNSDSIDRDSFSSRSFRQAFYEIDLDRLLFIELGKKPSNSRHEFNRNRKSAAINWYKENREKYSKNAAAKEISINWSVEETTARRWLENI
jgi:hypothetical protein